MNNFKDKIFIVTGGASGLGKALSERFAKEGGIVIIVDLNKDLTHQVLIEFRTKGYKAFAEIADVNDADAIQEIIYKAVFKHGRLDCIVNNAGINVSGELQNNRLKDINKQIDTNIKGVVNGCYHAYSIMTKQRFGTIINTASFVGLVPTFAMSGYTASKHAVVGFSMALRSEAKAFGIDVITLCPGFISTPIHDNAILNGVTTEKLFSVLPQKSPMPLDESTDEIIKGIKRNKALIVLPKTSIIIWFLYRIFPQAWATITKPSLKKLRN